MSARCGNSPARRAVCSSPAFRHRVRTAPAWGIRRRRGHLCAVGCGSRVWGQESGPRTRRMSPAARTCHRQALRSRHGSPYARTGITLTVRRRRPRRLRPRRRPGPPAGRSAAPAGARRRRRPGPAARRRRPAGPHGRLRPFVIDHPVGPAGLRQDDDRSAPGRPHRPGLRAGLGDLLRGGRPAQGLRRSGPPPRDRAGNAPVRRRDPPFQPGPAGLLPALRRGRDGCPGRRDHREPELRAQRRPPVTLPGHGPAPPG